MIQPQDVKDYTSFDTVKNREEKQLEWDIVQATHDIFAFVGHKFDDGERYPQGQSLPKEVQLAFIKVTEYYALVNSDESMAKGFTSERLGDYSYTIKSESGDQLEKISLESLLSDHIQKLISKHNSFRIRSI